MIKKILIIIPAFNEEKSIASVINDIKLSIPICDILVINDHSLDNTSIEARKTKMAMVVDLPYNIGIGGAVQTGFLYAARNDYSHAVQVDGDGQHIPSEIIKMIDAMDESGCDMVIGSRFLAEESFRTSKSRRIGIKIFYLIYRLIINTRITDGTSGFRIYNNRCIEFLSKNYPDDYPEPEAVVLLKKHGFTIAEVGVRMRERLHGKSSITPFKSMYYMVKVVMSIFFSYIRG